MCSHCLVEVDVGSRCVDDAIVVGFLCKDCQLCVWFIDNECASIVFWVDGFPHGVIFIPWEFWVFEQDGQLCWGRCSSRLQDYRPRVLEAMSQGALEVPFASFLSEEFFDEWLVGIGQFLARNMRRLGRWYDGEQCVFHSFDKYEN